MDQITKDRIKLLHPRIRDEVTDLINEANRVTGKEITIRIVQGYRSIAEQDALYAMGRTKPGKIVTNAKGGRSFHNYGLAIDFAFLVKDKGAISWDIKKDWDCDMISDWLEVVQIFIKAGWTWGGNFKSIKDNPHFEKTFGLGWRDLLARVEQGRLVKDPETGIKYVML